MTFRHTAVDYFRPTPAPAPPTPRQPVLLSPGNRAAGTQVAEWRDDPGSLCC